MKQFTDAAGHKWSISVNGGTIKRALDLLQLDLGRPLDGDPPFLTRFWTDIALMVDVIYVVCLPEADQRGVTDTQFAALLEGDAALEASEAFMEELAVFFQSLRQTGLRAAINKQREVVQRANDAAEGLIDGPQFNALIDAELKQARQKAAKLIQKTPGKSSASSRRSPRPTPTNTP